MAEANFLGRGMRWLLIAWTGAALLACAAPSPPPPTVLVFPAPVNAPAASRIAEPAPLAAGPEAPSATTQSILAGADRLRTLAPSELAQEIARLSTTPATPLNQMQLALALMQTRIPADSQRAVQLLQRLLAQDTPDARGLHPLARLLAAQMAEQRRLEENAERQAHLLRDAQRRVEQLNDRLEALRAIERARPSRAAN
jgi:hypothetical protein